MKNEKYEFLYNYTKSAFDDELQRFKNHEEKASKFISLLSIVIVGYTAIIKIYSNIFFPADRLLEWLCLGAVCLTFIALVSSWSLLFRSLNFLEMPRLPLDDSFIENYKKLDLPTNHYTLSITCKNALKLARESVAIKTKLLMTAYKEIAFSAWLITVSAIFITITSYTSQGVNMSEKDNSSQKQTEQTLQRPAEPDFTAPVPEYVKLFDHAISEQRTGTEPLNESNKK